jgi:hypothetical protein
MPHRWERCLCPDCTLVWERNLDGAWRYIARVAVPLPEEKSCPICTINLYMQWEQSLPILPDSDK